MKLLIWISGIALIIATSCSAVFAYQSYVLAEQTHALSLESAAQRWEYLIGSIPDDEFRGQMDKLGNERWEMIFARRASDGSDYKPKMSYELIFKRTVRPLPPILPKGVGK